MKKYFTIMCIIICGSCMGAPSTEQLQPTKISLADALDLKTPSIQKSDSSQPTKISLVDALRPETPPTKISLMKTLGFQEYINQGSMPKNADAPLKCHRSPHGSCIRPNLLEPINEEAPTKVKPSTVKARDTNALCLEVAQGHHPDYVKPESKIVNASPFVRADSYPQAGRGLNADEKDANAYKRAVYRSSENAKLVNSAPLNLGKINSTNPGDKQTVGKSKNNPAWCVITIFNF